MPQQLHIPMPLVAPEMTINLEHDGVELRFPAKPDPIIINRLKANSWRWSMRNRCWCKRRSPEAERFAAGIVADPAALTQAA